MEAFHYKRIEPILIDREVTKTDILGKIEREAEYACKNFVHKINIMYSGHSQFETGNWVASFDMKRPKEKIDISL